MQDQGIFNRFFLFLNSHPCFDAFKVSRAVELGILKSLAERVRDRSYPVRSSTQHERGSTRLQARMQYQYQKEWLALAQKW